MEYKPTQEQIEAQKLGTHIVLSANAGSGKTRVLTERYLKIICQSPENDINKVVAITFTEKAASEMLERIVKQVDDEFTNAKNDTEKKKFRQIKRKLGYAKIMTIHSFCLQILRDYAIDAGLQPNFKTLSQVESHLIKREAIYNALAQYLNQIPENQEIENNQTNETVKQILFTQYKPKEIKNFVEKLLAKPDIFSNIVELYKNKNKYFEEIFDLIKNIIPDFINILEFSLNLLDEKTADKLWTDKKNKYLAENLQQQILDDFKKIKDEFYKPQNDFSKFQTLVKNLLELCFIKADGNNFYIPKLFKKVNNENIFDFNFAGINENLNASKYRTKIVEFLSELEANNSLQFNLARIIVDITKLAKDEIDAQKQKLNGIDFDDMLLITRNLLLEHPEIAQTISSEYSNIMVDEFQDTNNTQYDIVKSLVPSLDLQNHSNNLQNNSNNISPQLFIVGDEKQSIYRFRNADVEVFHRAKQEIKISNEHFFYDKLQKTKILNSGIIKLTATFRMQPAITAFINKVCGNIFNEFYNSNNFYSSNSSNENNNEITKIEYTDLVCGRNGNYYSDKIQQNALLSDDFGSIKFLLTVKEKEEISENQNFINQNDENENNFDEEIPTSQESELLAKYIDFIVNGDSKNCFIQKEIDGKFESIKPQYADIAILFRSRTRLKNLILELMKKNIPFSLASGSNFFNEQIIYDLTSYLRFLNNPQDDLALIGVMLSPFFCLNYVDILNIHCEKMNTEKRNSLWEKVKIFCNENSTNEKNFANEKIKFLKNELEKQIEIAQVVSITHLLRMLLNTGTWLSNLIENPEKKQILKNIEKFISIAREFQNRGFSNLNDFITELEILSGISNDTEATEQKNENTITLQTIHSAKGLEFPIVILYNLNAKMNSVKSPIISKKYGITFDSPKTIQNEISNERIKSLAGILAAKNENYYETAENMRLLYVAMTRTKDHLILSANLERTKNGFDNKINSFFRKIFGSLDLNNEIIEELMTSDEGKIICPIHCDVKLLNERTVSKNISINIELINAVNKIAEKKQIAKNTSESVNSESVNKIENPTNTTTFIVDDTLKFTEKNRFFSFTELNQHKKIQANEKSAQIEYIKSLLGFQNFHLDLNYEFLNKSNVSDNNNIIGSNISGIEKGKIFHNILQKINDWYDGSISKLDEDLLDNLIENELILLNQEQKITKSIFVEKCKEIVSTDLLQKYKESLKTAKFEHKLYIPFGENFYTGIIDCLICDKNGNFEIWDWKTNSIPNHATVSNLQENYSLQMKMYILFLMYIAPEQYHYRARLLFTELASVNAANSVWTAEFIFTQKDKELIYSEIEKNINTTLVLVGR